jgi:hypothetical protein
MRRPHSSFFALLLVTVGGIAAGTVPAGARPAAADPAAALAVAFGQGPAPSGHWGPARAVPGLVIGPAESPESTITALSCAKPGNCTAAGFVASEANVSQAFIVEQRSGTWGQAAMVLSDPNAISSIAAISCRSVGNCVAGGSLMRPTDMFAQAFLAEEVNGSWQPATVVPGVAQLSQGQLSDVSAVSCASTGNCVVAGGFDVNGREQPFEAEERGGSWRMALPFQGPDIISSASKLTFIKSLSCSSPGNCAAAGSYADSHGFGHGFVVDETDGNWRIMRPLPSPLTSAVSNLTGVSCDAVDGCTAVGDFTSDSGIRVAFVLDQDNGRWDQFQQVPGVPGASRATSVSCAPGGGCAVIGNDTDVSGHQRIFVAERTAGGWQPAVQLTGGGAVSSSLAMTAGLITCPTAGNCRAAGTATISTPSGQAGVPVTVKEVNGTWGTANELAGDPMTVQSLACATPSGCALGGFRTDTSGIDHPVVANESAVTTSGLALSAARTRFGHEQLLRISVQVTPRTGGTPAGRVTVHAGSLALCVITLVNGKGSCRLPAKKLKPGSYQVAAAYAGSHTYAGSASAKRRLTVVR